MLAHIDENLKTYTNSEAKKQILEGRWKQFKGRLRETWGVLVDDDMERFKGQREGLEGYIEQKTGETREAIAQRIEEIAEALNYEF